MNFFRINLFVISLLFSANAFASPMGALKSISKWYEQISLQNRAKNLKRDLDISQPLYEDLLALPMLERVQLLDIFKQRSISINYQAIADNYFAYKPRLLEYMGNRFATENEFYFDYPFPHYVNRFIYITFNEDRYRNFLDELWQNKPYRDVFFELMDFNNKAYEIGRKITRKTIDFFTKEHFHRQPKFLLEWRKHAGSERLAAFIRSSLDEIEESMDHSMPTSEIFDRFLNEDPFGQTVLKACKESKDFTAEILTLRETS